MVSQGIYEHYKSTSGDRRYYQVLFLSHFEETLETMVHYIPLYFKNDKIFNDGITVWTRTLNNFTEKIEYNGKIIPRFRRVDSIVEK